MYLFDQDSFLKAACPGKVTPLVYRTRAGALTPLAAYERLVGAGEPEPSCLLDSAGGSSFLTEYSLIGVKPYKTLRLSGADPFPVLREEMAALAPAQTRLPLPFWGGAMGFLSYDAARYIEKLPDSTRDDFGLPECAVMFPGVVVVFEHATGALYVAANVVVGDDKAASAREADGILREALAKLAGPAPAVAPAQPVSISREDIRTNVTRNRFEEMVEAVREYIFAGDIFQANISVRFDAPYAGDPYSLYRSLRDINPSPFASYLDFGDFQIISSSPERLVRLRDNIADTRPIAGTRRRGGTADEDETLSVDLILNEKERAEHIMLVDLERNDLGRVCRYGTVLPSELFTIEKYSHVIHIVSNVRGELAQGKDQFDLLRAMFPGGTITGCPKMRCMEIIDEMEPTKRGPYTGSLGYFGFNGNMDTNIIIRTFLVKDGVVSVQAGSGIVADSVPAREYHEAVSKASALLKALGVDEEVVRWESLPA